LAALAPLVSCLVNACATVLCCCGGADTHHHRLLSRLLHTSMEEHCRVCTKALAQQEDAVERLRRQTFADDGSQGEEEGGGWPADAGNSNGNGSGGSGGSGSSDPRVDDGLHGLDRAPSLALPGPKQSLPPPGARGKELQEAAAAANNEARRIRAANGSDEHRAQLLLESYTAVLRTNGVRRENA
jgi:hypothetical protein